MTDWGGYWTEVKLDILRKYLSGFTRASKSAGATVYLDLFAGSATHRRPDTGATYPGSTTRAICTSPPFTRLVFWELEGQASRLKRELATSFPDESRYSVVNGDCNVELERGLAKVKQYQWAPTFAFIDPKGLDLAWETLVSLSQWRRDRLGRKVELWILMPEPALERVLGLRGVRGESSAARLDRLYGCDDWIAIHQRRRSGEFSPAETRAQFVNLFRWRLTSGLGYRTTHALQLGNVSDHPVYTMVFATDHKVGDGIMKDVYEHASVHEIPTMRAHAVSVRRGKRELERGVPRLFAIDEPPAAPQRYQYVAPWEPPARLPVPVVLDAEPVEPDGEGLGSIAT